MGNLNGYNADEHETSNFEPLPDGDYLAIAIASELKTTQSGTGEYLAFEWEILADGYNGRKLKSQLNLINDSAIAAQIGNSQLGDICRAVNVITPSDSSELHDKPLVLVVRPDQYTNDQDNVVYKNKITGYKPAVTVETVNKTVPKETKTEKSSSPPWARKR